MTRTPQDKLSTDPPEPSRRPVRDGIDGWWWRTRNSHWRPTLTLATAATIAMPVIEWAATGTATLNAALAAPLAGLAVPAVTVPRLRQRAVTDARQAPLASRVRRQWTRWAADDGKALDYPTTLGRRLFTGQARQTPRIKTVTRGPDRAVTVTAESPPFLSVEQWARNADSLGRALRQPTPTITVDRDRREATLVFAYPDDRHDNDTLHGTLPTIPAWDATPPDTLPDLRAVPVAKDAHGNTITMPILGTHVLVTGATGSGKGSVLWSLIGSIAPGISTRHVELWAIDPKAGVELGFGRDLFARFAGVSDDLDEEIVEILEDAVAKMRARLRTMRGNTRLYTPTPNDPLIIIVFDEFLTVTAAMLDRKLRDRAMRALTLLLSQGRAAAVTVIAAAQLAQKDALRAGMRDLIPYRVCLRVTDPDQVDMCMGASARKNGAYADLITERAQAGVGYLLEDGSRAPTLVRFARWADGDVKALAARYPAPATPGPTTAAPVPEGQPVTPPAIERVPAKRAAVEAILAVGITDPTEVAARADCSPRYVRKILGELATANGAGREEPQRGGTPNALTGGSPGPATAGLALASPELDPGTGGPELPTAVPNATIPSQVHATAPIPTLPGPAHTDPLRALP